MKRMIAVSLIFLTSGCAARDSRVQEIKSAHALKTRLDAGNVELVHALDAANYAKGHIPGAVNVDYEKMKPEMLPTQKDKPLIFYCASPMCPVSKMAANKAVSWGYTQVSVYEGGMSDWKSSGMTVEKGG
jgi:hydroxyacylglutathione hydrolase